MKSKLKICVFALSLLISGALFSQEIETLVVGQVFNKTDRSPVESVSVFFKGTNVHALTNHEGFFLISNAGSESVLVFSQVGYNRVEIRVRPGEVAGVEIFLEEKHNFLDELFVTPGVNPADDLMRRVVAARKSNRVVTKQQVNEQSLVLLSKKTSRRENNRLFDQFEAGNISEEDTLLLAPLYMEEATYSAEKGHKEYTHRKTFNTSRAAQNIISDLLRGLDTDLNFYNNTVSVMGKGLVSPLSSVGKSFYRYYLTDSISTESGKEYLLSFRSKNRKNLAFDGEMRIDSASLALRYIDAGLPRSANFNFVNNLHVSRTFVNKEGILISTDETATWGVTYDLFKDENSRFPELLINKKRRYSADLQTFVQATDSFAGLSFGEEELAGRMGALQETPLYKTASYIADALTTGYLRLGGLDLGPYADAFRLTKIEGFRGGIPLRTNERLMQNLMIGGHAMYGFRDQKWKYRAEVQLRMPIRNRFILGAKYLNDYRRIDYDYNDFLWREDPLATGDESVGTTFFSLRSQHRMSMRKEFSAFLNYAWSPGVESGLVYREVNFLANELLPMIHNGTSYNNLYNRNIALTGRFSFGQRTIDRHFQRLYVKSKKPVFYITADVGDYRFEEQKGSYAKLSGSFLHTGQTYLGEWRYMIESGKYYGALPYFLLKFIQGKENGAYNRYEFALMNNREFLTDSYVNVFTEHIFNGIFFNRLPLIKHLNLREVVALKASYGQLSDRHAVVMQIPSPSGKFQTPYSEVSFGFTNLLGLISVHSIWRLTDRDKPGVSRWGMKATLLLAF